MEKINKEKLDKTSAAARKARRRRMNYNFHRSADDPLQRMLNAMEPGTYIRPHKHENPDKTEVFLVLRGRILVVEFDDDGSVRETMVLDPATENWAAEIAPRTWHTVLAMEPGTVAYEIKNGPYNPLTDKDFASWAPAEGDAGVAAFMDKLVEEGVGSRIKGEG